MNDTAGLKLSHIGGQEEEISPQCNAGSKRKDISGKSTETLGKAWSLVHGIPGFDHLAVVTQDTNIIGTWLRGVLFLQPFCKSKVSTNRKLIKKKE